MLNGTYQIILKMQLFAKKKDVVYREQRIDANEAANLWIVSSTKKKSYNNKKHCMTEHIFLVSSVVVVVFFSFLAKNVSLRANVLTDLLTLK